MLQRAWQAGLGSQRYISVLSRLWNGPRATLGGAEGEKKIQSILFKTFPKAQNVQVTDISCGCGAMYDIIIAAPEFKGLSIVKQHRLVTEALKEEIKDMHGLKIQTATV